MIDQQQPGIVSRTTTALKTPFGNAMTWTQLAAVVVFVTVVLFAWRQVVLMISTEI